MTSATTPQQADREAAEQFRRGKGGKYDREVNAYAQLFAHHAQQARLEERRKVLDRDYMIQALVQMLGPKGRQVWQMWQDKGVVRQHTTWGPNAPLHDGEAIAQCHLDMEAAAKTPIEDVDGHIDAIRKGEAA